MAKVLFKRIENSDYIDNVTVEDGSFIITGDGKCYIDYGNTRVEMNTTSNTPIGTILPYGGITIPEGWLLCDGSAVSRTTYSNLYLAIRETYGSGDGSTTFNLPNLCGRVPVGYDESDSDFDSLGETGGEKKHTLIANELPKLEGNIIMHSAGEATNIADMNGIVSSTRNNNNQYKSGGNTTSGAGSIGTFKISFGNNEAHNIVQPYITLKYIIKY